LKKIRLTTAKKACHHLNEDERFFTTRLGGAKGSLTILGIATILNFESSKLIATEMPF
jgi:hypothetical protein